MAENTNRADVTAARKAVSGELLQVHAAAEFAGWRLRTVDTGEDGAQVWTYDRSDRKNSTLDRVVVHMVGGAGVDTDGNAGTVSRVVTYLDSSAFATEARRADFDEMGAFEFVYPAFAGE